MNNTTHRSAHGTMNRVLIGTMTVLAVLAATQAYGQNDDYKKAWDRLRGVRCYAILRKAKIAKELAQAELRSQRVSHELRSEFERMEADLYQVKEQMREILVAHPELEYPPKCPKGVPDDCGTLDQGIQQEVGRATQALLTGLNLSAYTTSRIAD